MSRLLLLRHAKAAWPQPGATDFERPLSPAGVDEARLIGRTMRALGPFPSRIICSSALRATQTWREVAGAFDRDPSQALVLDSLYQGDASSYLDVIHDAGSAPDVLLVGHNPMIEDLASELSGKGNADARSMLAKGFPTAGLAIITIDGDPAMASRATSRLDRFVIPSAL